MRIALILLAAALLQYAPSPQPVDPSTLTTKDQHQGFLVAAVPLRDAAAAKAALDKLDPIKAGILPIEVYFHNSTKDPVRVDLTTIRLDIDAPSGQKLHLMPLTMEQAASEISHPKGASAPSARRFPPIIGVPVHDDKESETANKLQLRMFQTDVVPPGATVHGFIFFDLNHAFDILPYSTLYVPDVKSIASSQAMIFFEVPLKPESSHE